MPRSGTSLLEQILSSHDNVVGGGEMPILQHLIKNNFFKDDLIKKNIFEDSKKFSVEKLNFVNQLWNILNILILEKTILLINLY
jgi:hypothetical protein